MFDSVLNTLLIGQTLTWQTFSINKVSLLRIGGNKAKEGILKQVFQENKTSQIFWKTNISYHLIRILTCAYQGIRTVRFSVFFENLTCFVFLKHSWVMVMSNEFNLDHCLLFFRAPVTSAATGWVLSTESFTVGENGAGLFKADISSLINDGSINPTTLYWKAPYQFLGDQASSGLL